MGVYKVGYAISFVIVFIGCGFTALQLMDSF